MGNEPNLERVGYGYVTVSMTASDRMNTTRVFINEGYPITSNSRRRVASSYCYCCSVDASA